MLRYSSPSRRQETSPETADSMLAFVNGVCRCCLGVDLCATSPLVVYLAEGPLIKKGDYAHFRYFVLDSNGFLKYYEIPVKQTINDMGDVVVHIPKNKLTLTNQLTTRNLRGVMLLHPSLCATEFEISGSGLDLTSLNQTTSSLNSEMRCVRRTREILVTGFATNGTLTSWKLQASSHSHYDMWVKAFRIAMRPVWVPNSKHCQICHGTFSAFFRPHHCRKCGTCVCYQCSHLIPRLPLLGYTDPVRICCDCDPLPEPFLPGTKVLVYGIRVGTIVQGSSDAAMVHVSMPARETIQRVHIRYVERYSEMILAANRIKSRLKSYLAYRLFRTQLHFHTWSLLETLEEQRAVQTVKILKTSISVNELQSLTPAWSNSWDQTAELQNQNLPDNVVPASYRGAHLTFPLTENQVLKLVDAFRNGLPLHQAYVTRLLNLILEQPLVCMSRLTIPNGVQVVIVGDLHGQFEDLMTIFDRKGVPSKHVWYVFNGDFVDRGLHGVEVILTLLAYKLLYPSYVFLNRGNHEASMLNHVFGFEEEVMRKYRDSGALFLLFEQVFNRLPLCTLVQDAIFIVHGGVPHNPGVTLADIQAIDIEREPPTGASGLLADDIFCQMLWNDPQPHTGITVSKRGCGYEFGPDVTQAFCKTNNLQMIIRSHESHEDGYVVCHDGLILSVFSASAYCGFQTNKGAFVVVTNELKPYVVQFYAQPLQKYTCHRNWRAQTKAFEDKTLWSLQELIGQKCDALRQYFRGQPFWRMFLTRLQWKQALTDVLGVPVHFLLYAPQLVVLDDHGKIDCYEFLRYYEVSSETDVPWCHEMLGRIFGAILQDADPALPERSLMKRAFEYFDRSLKQRITFDDLKDTLRVLGYLEAKPASLPMSSSSLSVPMSSSLSSLTSPPSRAMRNSMASLYRDEASVATADDKEDDDDVVLSEQQAFELMQYLDTNEDGIVGEDEFATTFYAVIGHSHAHYAASS
ncbi:hypothetical protein SPRG_06715 [Saprolegnia parasitica CBS 223.65]|uniref:Serine/threonine-protein phosphatase n=1 Tax=Saprolegnia parasitica (strain CBS 223.65) TaxID=695850 RepID=A0A067CPK6_SAPPC|nr:hypothetical protein SPRG_06715 [Saprolegnia parasitica CBS 223.65]KDO28476.1 hypothetical protein SPRG_06715 [Saprolegnia parasitica CBS 223.65]|eukprot:XP_012200914.1 hypothetical protein SPRG_06715 [Saprolegnia parasitica CBS 223.65]